MRRNMRMRATRIAAVAAVAAVVASLAACSSDEAESSSSEEAPIILVGNYVGGVPSAAVIGLDLVAEHAEIQKKNNIKVEMVNYTSISDLYTDLARGRVDLATTGPASSAALANEGAPIQLAGTVAHSTTTAMSTNKEWTAEGIRGSRIVAQVNSSSWKSVQASIEQKFGLVGDKDYEIMNADSTAAAAIQAASGKADFAIVRAEQVILAEKQFPKLKPVGTPEQLSLVSGLTDWGYIIAYNTSKIDADSADRFMDALIEITKMIQDDPSEPEAKAVAGGQEPGIMQDFITSGDVNYDVQKIGEARASLAKEFDVLLEFGAIDKLPDSSYYGE